VGELARGYSWPPFEPGNEAALTHGATSPRYIEPRAAEIAEAILSAEDMADLTSPRYRLDVLALARAEAQIERLDKWLGSEVGDLSDTRRLAAYGLLDKAERRAAGCRTRLGMSPLARARLGRDHAAAGLDAAQLLTKLREAAERQQEGTDDQQ